MMRQVHDPCHNAHLAMRSLGVRWRVCPASGRLSQGHGEAWWVTAATTARSSAATDSISVLVSVKVYSTALTCTQSHVVPAVLAECVLAHVTCPDLLGAGKALSPGRLGAYRSDVRSLWQNCS